MTLEQLYDRALVIALLRQERFSNRVADQVWWVDPQNGVARLFTPARQPASGLLSIRMLGTEGGGEWLWAWANPLNFPVPATRAFAEEMRAAGARIGVPELTTPRLRCDGVTSARTFAIIAVGLYGNGGYVLHRAGPLTAAFVLPPMGPPATEELASVGQTIGRVLGGSHPYHRALDVVTGAFAGLGIPHEIAGETVTARDPQRGTITVSVDGGRFRCDIQPVGGARRG